MAGPFGARLRGVVGPADSGRGPGRPRFGGRAAGDGRGSPGRSSRRRASGTSARRPRQQPLLGGHRGHRRRAPGPGRTSPTSPPTTACRAGSPSAGVAGRGSARALAPRRRHRRPRSTSSCSAAAGRATCRPTDRERRRATGSPRLRAVAADPRAELLVAGRTSATTHRLARDGDRVADPRPRRGARPAHRRRRAAAAGIASSGALLERDGPASLGGAPRAAGDAALIDTPGPARPPARSRTSAAGHRPRTAAASRPPAPRAHRRPVAARR